MRKFLRILLHFFLGYTAVVGTTVILFTFCWRLHRWVIFSNVYIDISRYVDDFFLALAVAISCLTFCEYTLQIHRNFLKENRWAALFCVSWMGLSFLSLFEMGNYRLHPYSEMVWFNSLFVFSIFLARFQRCFSDRSIFYQWLLGIVFLWPLAYGIIDNWNSEWGPPATDAGFLAERLALFAVPVFFVIPGLLSAKASKMLSPFFGLLTVACFVCFTNRSAMMFLTSGRWELLRSWNPFEDPQIPVLIGVMVVYPALVVLTSMLISWFLSRWGAQKEIASNAESVRASVD